MSDREIELTDDEIAALTKMRDEYDEVLEMYIYSLTIRGGACGSSVAAMRRADDERLEQELKPYLAKQDSNDPYGYMAAVREYAIDRVGHVPGRQFKIPVKK